MRRVLLVLLLVGLVLLVAWTLAGLPGHVSARIGSLAIDAATPVVALGLLLAFVVLYVLFRLLGALVRLPRTLRARREARRRRQGDLAVTRTLVALAADDKGGARREAGRARRLLGDSPQTLLLAAEAARLAGRTGEAEAALRALVERKDAALLGLRGLLRDAVGREDWAEAAALAREAEAVHPGALWLRQERERLAVRAGNWPEALSLADPDAPKAALAAAAAEAEPDPARALKLAKQAWEEDPSLAPAALAYASRLRAEGREARAQVVLRHSWSIAPQPELASLALAPVSEALERVQATQRLTEANPTHAESRLLLARTALAAGLTGEARRHAEAAHAAGLNQRRLWLLLAEVEEAEGAADAQREALRHAATAEDDPAWQCGNCQATHMVWQPACPRCFTVGSLRWTEPVRRSFALTRSEGVQFT